MILPHKSLAIAVIGMGTCSDDESIGNSLAGIGTVRGFRKGGEAVAGCMPFLAAEPYNNFAFHERTTPA